MLNEDFEGRQCAKEIGSVLFPFGRYKISVGNLQEGNGCSLDLTVEASVRHLSKNEKDAGICTIRLREEVIVSTACTACSSDNVKV